MRYSINTLLRLSSASTGINKKKYININYTAYIPPLAILIMNTSTIYIDYQYFLQHFKCVKKPLSTLDILQFISNLEMMSNSTIKEKYIFCTNHHVKQADINQWKKANVEVCTDNNVEKCESCNKECMIGTVISISMAMISEIIKKRIKTIILLGGDRNYKEAIKLCLNEGTDIVLFADMNDTECGDLFMLQGIRAFDLPELITMTFQIEAIPQEPIKMTMECKETKKKEVINEEDCDLWQVNTKKCTKYS